MRLLLSSLLFLLTFQFVKAQKSGNTNSTTLNYTQAMEQYLSEKKNTNYLIKDTLVIFNLDKSIVDTMPLKLKGITLKFITWGETQNILGTIDTIRAMQIFTTNFDNIRSFIFLPLKITKNNIFRDYEHMCGVSYSMNINTMTLEYKGIHCGGFKMDD